ncbi:uncharacterized protein [Argopecten irradians]|uniref:uncharacterized protein n=1 Tax=Argopecten irradians TaxID=31199 RepID=UPI0037165DF7
MASNTNGQELDKNIQRNVENVKRPIPAGGKPKPRISKKPVVSSKPVARLPSQTSVDSIKGNNSTGHASKSPLHNHTQSPSPNENDQHNSRDPSKTTTSNVPEPKFSPLAQHKNTGSDDVIDSKQYKNTDSDDVKNTYSDDVIDSAQHKSTGSDDVHFYIYWG